MSTDIAGYTYDTALAASPVSLEDLNLLLATLLWTDDDAAALEPALRWNRRSIKCSTSGTATSVPAHTSSRRSTAPTGNHQATT